MDYTQSLPDWSGFRRIIQMFFDFLSEKIEKVIIGLFHLEAYRELIYGSETDSEQGIEVEGKHLVGLIVIELWLAIKRVFAASDSFWQTLRDLHRRILGILRDAVQTTMQKYRHAFSVWATGKLSNLLSRFHLLLEDISVAPRLLESISAAIGALWDEGNGGFVAQLRTAGSILLTGVIEGIGNAIPVPGECDTLYELLRRIVEMIAQYTTLVERITEFCTQDVFRYFEEHRRYLDEYYAELLRLDVDEFRRQTTAYSRACETIATARNDEELRRMLRLAYRELGIALPWANSHGSFDSFMRDRTARLRFE